jgi:hypothetical protein
MGFKVHKSKNAIRTIVVPPRFKRREERVRSLIRQSRPEEAQLLLLRGAGTHNERARDVWIDKAWSQALKLATDDPAVRPRSVRAAVFQEGAWPGWSDIARKLMDGVASTPGPATTSTCPSAGSQPKHICGGSTPDGPKFQWMGLARKTEPERENGLRHSAAAILSKRTNRARRRARIGSAVQKRTRFIGLQVCVWSI